MSTFPPATESRQALKASIASQRAAKLMNEQHTGTYHPLPDWKLEMTTPDPKTAEAEADLLRACHLSGQMTAAQSAQHFPTLLAPAIMDKQMLDFLDSKGSNWVARESTTGRGYRLHQTSESGIGPASARDALRAALKASQAA